MKEMINRKNILIVIKLVLYYDKNLHFQNFRNITRIIINVEIP